MKNTKSLTIFAMLALAPMCFAPIKDKPTGAEFHGELTQDQLTAAQGGGSFTAPTPAGGSSTLEDPKADIGQTPSDAGASSVVANAQADQVLKQAEKDVKASQEAKAKPFAALGVTILAVGAALFGGKVWLDRSIPEKG